MLLIGLTSLLLAIPLYSSTITPTLLTRITAIILLFSAAISFNRLYVQAIGSGLGLYSGLFHVTTVTQAMEIFLYIVGAFILLPWAPYFSQSDTDKDIVGFQFPHPRAEGNGNRRVSIAEYPLIILFTTMGASFLISSADLVSMYLSIELQSFAVYILAAIYRNSESATSAGLKYFLLGALSSALILLGSSLIYAYTGLTNFEGIYMITNCVPNGGDQDQSVVLGVLIIGVGFLFKVAAAPFHNWAPDVYDGVPTIVTTWLTVMPKISIFIFLLELSPLSIPGTETGMGLAGDRGFFAGTALWQNLLLTTSLLSLVIGTVVGLAQYRLKRLLAFSTISHVGFLLLALSVNSEESMTSFLFYLVQYSITNLNAFFVVLALGYLMSLPITAFPQRSLSPSTAGGHEIGNWGKGNRNDEKGSFHPRSQGAAGGADISLISQLKGQFHYNPILGLSFALCLFSMAGIPPLVGFFAKYRVLYSAIENGYYFLSLVGILASVISAAYYLRIIRVIHFSPLSLSSCERVETVQVLVERGKSLSDDSHRKAAPLPLTATHSYVIAVLTLFIALFILSPTLVLNSSNLLALSLFTS